MKASEAKKKALENKQKVEEAVKTRKDKALSDNFNLLYKHFIDHINVAVSKGRLTTDGISFAADRFAEDIIRDVAAKLREDGFHLQMEKHNAYQKVNFIITWS